MKVTVQTRGGAREFESLSREEDSATPRSATASSSPTIAPPAARGTCKARLVGGRAESAWPEAPGSATARPGEILTCQSVALESCALEVDRLTPAEAGVPRPASLKGTLRDPRPLTDDVIAFEVELEARLDFAAGQFVLLETPHIDGARAYSIADSSARRRATDVGDQEETRRPLRRSGSSVAGRTGRR